MIESATRGVESLVGLEIEPQGAGGGLAELEEDGIPSKPPSSRRIGIERQAVAEESETHVPVFAADGIVEVVVSVADGGKPPDGCAEKDVVLSSAPDIGIDGFKVPQAVVGRGIKVRCRPRLGECEAKEAP